MNRFGFVAITVCVLGTLGLPVRASAQDLPIGKAVHVTALDGSRRGGTLVSMDTTTVVIDQSKGTIRIPLTDVRFVTRDSSAIAAGTGIGLGAGFVSGLIICGNASDCPGEAIFLYAGVGAGIGAGVGGLIKYLRSNARVVYRAPAKTTVAVSPVVGRRQFGLGGVIKW